MLKGAVIISKTKAFCLISCIELFFLSYTVIILIMFQGK